MASSAFEHTLSFSFLLLLLALVFILSGPEIQDNIIINAGCTTSSYGTGLMDRPRTSGPMRLDMCSTNDDGRVGQRAVGVVCNQPKPTLASCLLAQRFRTQRLFFFCMTVSSYRKEKKWMQISEGHVRAACIYARCRWSSYVFRARGHGDRPGRPTVAIPTRPHDGDVHQPL